MVIGDAPHGEHDHSTTKPAVREILASLGLSGSESELRWVESYSHSAWMTRDVVIRYRVIGPPGRLIHEANVAACLPIEALYPKVIASGWDGSNDWLVTERIAGESLFQVWPRLSVQERKGAVLELATALHALHQAPARHLSPPCLFGGAPLLARSEYIDALADIARRASGRYPRDMLGRVLDRLEESRLAIDDEADVMAHHDLNFGQCIWRDGHLVGLVDLEMSHANTPDWDLPVLLGMCADSRLNEATPRSTGTDAFELVPAWFRGAYEAPFVHPLLVCRLRVYDLIYTMASLSEQLDLERILTVLENGTRYEYLVA